MVVVVIGNCNGGVSNLDDSVAGAGGSVRGGGALILDSYMFNSNGNVDGGGWRRREGRTRWKGGGGGDEWK